ncbi:MAG: hypothetical protein COZ46_01295 [Verrucomicrobia bacterium CG_4_10_14_3_um_filter_43_23]|nr:MAG: hypothetical protein AUJ82_01330 [Verrucomicrobia bacterium CG1_02_43_26]PIP59539.1 MAG: hypothetical protein COX01_02900 [Verrucomicrobia bacterium CG22_combo_CG10-13_8_21_14_all_43_17]PIX58840.1 MAG: hypothetical protein COZ46_01295 [Verrucomicrobia bacterium CG_4_10_14_3_um_filter_43_23]PIY60935.1 MAG: hypothetical protein COY94_07975 [Verrucomicrobia bacterium CG_4_10_14_0_8_um_filter_43_34]PJA44849.1 MAG: hypothetical protein CO175_00785 [Verrucomicrobia bacterium CG_4_9_14_3_um_fi
MNIRDILSELGKQMGLGNLKLDENKVCRLIFDKKFTVDIEANDDESIAHIYSAVCIIPPIEKEALYEKLLDANPFGRGTGGASFGIDLEMGEILITRTLVLDKTDYQDFVNALESFVNHLEAWTEKIDKQDYLHDKDNGIKKPKTDKFGKPKEEEPEEHDKRDDHKPHTGPDHGFLKA